MFVDEKEKENGEKKVMKKHYTPKGTLEICNAEKRSCPYGGNLLHFDNEQEGETFADDWNELRVKHNILESNLEKHYLRLKKDSMKNNSEELGDCESLLKNLIKNKGLDFEYEIQKIKESQKETMKDMVKKIFGKNDSTKSKSNLWLSDTILDDDMIMRYKKDSINSLRLTYDKKVIPNFDGTLITEETLTLRDHLFGDDDENTLKEFDPKKFVEYNTPSKRRGYIQKCFHVFNIKNEMF